MSLKEVFKEFFEKFLIVGLSSGLTSAIPILSEYSGRWGLAVAILAAVLATVNKYLKDKKKIYDKAYKAVRK